MTDDTCLLLVSYPGPIDTALDRRLEMLLGPRAGSGAGMGERDLDWSYPTLADAQAAAGQVRLQFGKRVKVAVDRPESEP